MINSMFTGLSVILLLMFIRQTIAFRISMRWIDISGAVLEARVTNGYYLERSYQEFRTDAEMIGALRSEVVMWKLDVWTLEQAVAKDRRLADLLVEFKGRSVR